MNKGKFPISIVIPAFNEEKYIGRCLESLVEQKTNLQYEVIVVDNNSYDKTRDVVKSFQDKLNLRLVNEKKQGRGAARARGFREAKGEIILSTDADAIVYPDWIETLIGGIDEETVATTTSSKVLDLGFIKNAIFNITQPISTWLYRLFFGNFWLAGFSFAIKKDVYVKSGGFNPNLQALEDSDLAQRVAKFGNIKLIPKPVIFSGRRFKKGLMMGIFEYIKIFILAYTLKRRPVFMGNPR